MADLSIAVVGCGGVGHIHLSCWANLSGVRIAAVCDTDGVAVARTAAQYAGTAAFTDVAAMLEAGPFDIVDVCTPTGEHIASVTAALRCGAHVLCEAPMTARPEEARALVQLAADRERLLMPGFCHRFHPPILFARDLVENDDLGIPVMFRCRFSGLWADASEKIANRELEPDPLDFRPGSGVLLNTAIHGIDLFRHFCGEVASIQGLTALMNPKLDVEDTVGLLLQGVSGAIGVVEASWSLPGGRNVVEIYGSAGACIVDYDAATLRYLTADQPVWRHHDEGGPNRFEREIAHFADVVRGLQAPVVSASDGARAVELCWAVYDSKDGHSRIQGA